MSCWLKQNEKVDPEQDEEKRQIKKRSKGGQSVEENTSLFVCTQTDIRGREGVRGRDESSGGC